MSRIERELYDLEEHLRRNDDSADSSTYLTIVGIANDVSEIEAKNVKMRELLQEAAEAARGIRDLRYGKRLAFIREVRELGIEVPE